MLPHKHTIRRSLYCVALVGVAIAAGCANERSENNAARIDNEQHPNIILILADDLGYGDASFLNPASKIKTPRIDQLAAEGMSFTDAHSNSAVCTPTRYGVLTGRYAWRGRLKSGVLKGYSEPLIEEGRETLGSLLQDNGYNTALIGKWHLGLAWTMKGGQIQKDAAFYSKDSKAAELIVDFAKPLQKGVNDYGFDYSFYISASADMPPYVFIENDKPTQIPSWNEIQIEGEKLMRRGMKAPGWEAADILPTFTDEAIKWIAESANNDKPFFLYMPLNSPHTPVTPNQEFSGASDAGDYGDFVYETDHAIGRVVDAVEQAGVTENTIIIVTSDNGPETYMYARFTEYGHDSSGVLRGAKRDSWEGGHRVPFIVKWPAVVKPGSVSEEVITTTDFMATFADMLGVSLPATSGEDSVSFRPVLENKAYKAPLRQGTIHHSAGGGFSIRHGDWKYIDGPGSHLGNRNPNKRIPPDAYEPGPLPAQLYNLREDIAEENNLLEQYPEKAEALKAMLEEYIAADRSQ